ncbi:MAG: aspartyl protease family protein [Dehalococcoidia bacterium]
MIKSTSIVAVLTTSIALAQQAAVEVPLILAWAQSDSLVPMVEIELAGAKGRFLIDTGAGRNALTKPMIEVLKLETKGKVRAAGVGNNEMVTTHTMPAFRIGTRTFGEQPAIGLDLAGVEKILETRIDGLLGTSFFAAAVVTLDFPNRKLRLEAADAKPPQGAVELRLGFALGTPHLTARVNGSRKRRFVIDTGASRQLLLHGPFVKRMKWLDELELRTKGRISGVGGGHDVYSVRIDRFDLGLLVLTNVPTFLADPARAKGLMADSLRAGSVGTGLLYPFAVTFDYARKRLWLHRDGLGKSFDTGGDFGFDLRLRKGEMQFYRLRDNGPAKRAGINKGDILLELDGAAPPSSVHDAYLKIAVAKMLKLRVVPRGKQKPVDVELRRAHYGTLVKTPESKKN